MNNEGWSRDIPVESGSYWFYGNPWKGALGIDYKDNQPPDNVKLYLIKVQINKFNVILTCEGTSLTPTYFDKTIYRTGILGYFKKIEEVKPPDDVLNLFKK